MISSWLEPHPTEVPADFQQSLGGHPLLAETLLQRGITTVAQAQAFLDPTKYIQSAPIELPDLSKAADRIEQALQRGEMIGVWGDFDMDGQTSAAVLVSTLRQLGGQVIYHLPVRARESHGINLPGLAHFLDQGVQLLVSCDTGITAHEAVLAAQARGVDTLITDHHSLPPELPPAYAVINPQRLHERHPLHSLAGVGTAYKLAEELANRAGQPQIATSCLDLVALGTIADLALLTGDNRCLVQLGLDAVRRQPRPAIQVMLELADVVPGHLREEHISFTLAPRLNALGRLEDANPAVEFLLASDPDEARPLAEHLETLNASRKLLCDQVFQAAQDQIRSDPSLLEFAALVLAHPLWPAGVIGIVASRLVELYHRPTILFTAPPGEAARGSARSIDGVNITAAISACPGLLSFGGHPMAAGLSIPSDRVPEFRRALSRVITRMLPEGLPEPQLVIDSFLPLEMVTLDLVESLDRLAPYGPGNPSLVLASRELRLKSAVPVGRAEEHLQLIVEDPVGFQSKVIWWQGAGSPLPEGRFDLAYTARASNYRGQTDVQLEFVAARSLDHPIWEVAPSASALQIEDFRQVLDPAAVLSDLCAREPDLLIWQEGENLSPYPGVTRAHLHPADALAIWSIPSGRAELQTALRLVDPRRVFLFAIRPSADQLKPFLTRLAGLVRYCIKNNQGWVDLSDLAGASAQRLTAARKGLDWWHARGSLRLLEEDSQRIHLAEGGHPDPSTLPTLEAQLNDLLAETAAFRDFYLRADPRVLAAIPESRRE